MSNKENKQDADITPFLKYFWLWPIILILSITLKWLGYENTVFWILWVCAAVSIPIYIVFATVIANLNKEVNTLNSKSEMLTQQAEELNRKREGLEKQTETLIQHSKNLKQEKEKLAHETEKRNKEVQDLSNKIDKVTIPQANKIKELEHNKQLIAYATHNLKNAMNNIFYKIRSIEIPQEVSDELLESFNHLNTIIKEMRNLEANAEKSSFAIVELENTFQKFNRHYFLRHKVKFEWFYQAEKHKNIIINCRFIEFFQVMLNLMTNAVDAMPLQQTEKIVTVFVQQELDNTLIIVADNAPSIEKINEDKIFEKGFSTKNSTGMGLAYVKEVVITMNATISFVNNNHTNNFKKFIITIPLILK